MTQQEANPEFVDARPEKDFFISMLIKDIDLVPAIVDLVDNSVDGARSMRGQESLDGLEVRLSVKSDGFEITDNCGGMEAETARRYAFRFGRPKSFRGVDKSVGQFGVGMKRALFKIGNAFHVSSVAESSSFELGVKVPEWEASPNWDFRFESVNEDQDNTEDTRGVSINVTELHPGVSMDFSSIGFLGGLIANIRLRHEDALSKGLRLLVNDNEVQHREHRVLVSEMIGPIRREFQLNGPDGNGTVDVTLVAGLSPLADSGPEKDPADAEAFNEPADAGWYLYCNGRLLLAADRSVLTGWGVAAAAYHPQYRYFRGYVYLWSDDSSLLPWNTTKTGVDQESPVFRAVQQEMFKALASVLAVLNQLKKERQHQPDDNRPLHHALNSAEPTLVLEVPKNETFLHPPAPRTKTSSSTTRIQYDVENEQFEAVKSELGVSTIADVGRETFAYYYENEIGT